MIISNIILIGTGGKMEYTISTVKRYSRELSRTLKDGKKKKYTTVQFTITIPERESPFNDKQVVMIIPVEYKDKILNMNLQGNTITDLKMELKEYKEKTEDLQDKHDKLLYQIISLERLNKNYLVALTKMEGLSFMNRLFNRIPKNIKALTDGTENNDKK
jgi:FtsZ-binding cell division protein ZapB